MSHPLLLYQAGLLLVYLVICALRAGLAVERALLCSWLRTCLSGLCHVL